MDPMREAMNRRRAKGFDLTAAPSEHDKSKEQDPHGDLAPDPEGAGRESSDSPEKLRAEEKAMHAKEGAPLQSAVAHHDSDNPEHEPLARGLGHDQMGHEQTAMDPHDPEMDAMMMAGHEHDTLSRPKTLGARVRMALQSKKGK